VSFNIVTRLLLRPILFENYTYIKFFFRTCIKFDEVGNGGCFLKLKKIKFDIVWVLQHFDRFF
jgi:hypothetical protein